MRQLQRYLSHIFLISIVFGSHSSYAGFYFEYNGLLESSLQLEHIKTEFDFNNYITKTTQDTVNLNWFEPLGTNFHGGIEIGYIDLSINQGALTAPVFASGRFAGLLFRYIPINSSRFDSIFSLNYRYFHTKSRENTEIIWHQSRISATLVYHLAKKWDVHVSADYRTINGEQRSTSGAGQIGEFSAANKEGYRLGINYNINRTGQILLEGLGGYQQGARISFSRYF